MNVSSISNSVADYFLFFSIYHRIKNGNPLPTVVAVEKQAITE